MIAILNEKEEQPRIGYYSVIPATVLFNEHLKANEKLLYALITALSNREGYCYASNKYLAGKLKVNQHTISHWLTDLREHNFIYVEIIRNEKQEIIQRKIYPNDVPYVLNNTYPYIPKNTQGIDQNSKDNNIRNNNINTHTVFKKNYAEKVNLYENEYKKLVEEYGEKKANKCIEELSLYKKSKGVEYASDYDAIKRWVIIRVEELEARQNYKKSKKKTNNFEQRDYPEGFFDSLYANNNFEKTVTEDEEEIDFEM